MSPRKYYSKTSYRRLAGGNTMAEAPIAMWLILVFLLMPLLILGSIALRTAFLYAAAKDGAHDAARAKTYFEGTDAKPPAMFVAQQSAERMGKSFSGLEITSVSTAIVVTSLSSGAVSVSTGKLALPADASKNLYQLQVTVKGNVDPIIRYQLPFFGNVPGLTTSMPLTAVSSEMVENPDGLNK